EAPAARSPGVRPSARPSSPSAPRPARSPGSQNTAARLPLHSPPPGNVGPARPAPVGSVSMAGAGEKDAKAGSEERTTERRMLAASAVMHAGADSTRDVAGEDFLFHLYRGSELLQDNRVHEAKEELEQALTLQPRDPKGQDLLAVVYFRIGHYPRAIQIYEQL